MITEGPVPRATKGGDVLAPVAERGARGGPAGPDTGRAGLRPGGTQGHDRSPRPDELSGADVTTTLTDEGTVSIFLVIDHGTAEGLGIQAVRLVTRSEAIESLHQAVLGPAGGYAEAILEAAGLSPWHDHGSQFLPDVSQRELGFLGSTTRPSFVRARGAMVAPSGSSGP